MELKDTQPQSITAVISEKVQSVTTVGQKSHEEIWDRTPMLSRMNSMECWDYTIELECLNGPEG
jgi:hypothetical protein